MTTHNAAPLPGYDFVVLHYDEIGLKGGNRRHFEKRFIQNVKTKLGDRMFRWERETGQITLELTASCDHAEAKSILEKIPGMANFSFAKRMSWSLDELGAEVSAYAQTQEFQTFKINTRRHDKSFPLQSVAVNEQLGGAVLGVLPGKKVKLKNPDLEIKVEITDGYAYISGPAQPSFGGLPTNPKQKVVVLLSGGLDSPVAASMMMKRGCQAILVHFQNQNQLADSVEDKIHQLAEQLAKFQLRTELYIVPFGELQKEIITGVKEELRMLVYRRVMLRLASDIAKRNRAQFLVTGDSFSQVASQTYENLSATYVATDMRILTPVIGLDKKEIVTLARRIGTYDISALPYGDCCSYFLPKHPELRGRAEHLAALEEPLALESLGAEAIDQAKRMTL